MELQTVTFQWSTKHGKCHECGLPAAFYRGVAPQDNPEDTDKLCAICAANNAANGEMVRRIEEL